MPNNLAYELHSVISVTDRYAESYLRDRGLSYPQYKILTVIAANPSLTGKALAEMVRVSPAAISKSLRAMIQAGLVVNTSLEGMGNVQRLETTAAGRDLMDAAGRELTAPLTEICNRLDIDEDSLAAQLASIAELARGYTPPRP